MLIARILSAAAILIFLAHAVSAQGPESEGMMPSEWGPDDERGALNFITPSRILAACALPGSKPISLTIAMTHPSPTWYQVVLWNDEDHSYEYVILMMRQLFAHSLEKGFQIAKIVDNDGRAICLTTTKEHAELKRDQIHAFGPDKLIERCDGAMWATIEPVDS